MTCHGTAQTAMNFYQSKTRNVGLSPTTLDNIGM